MDEYHELDRLLPNASGKQVGNFVTLEVVDEEGQKHQVKISLEELKLLEGIAAVCNKEGVFNSSQSEWTKLQLIRKIHHFSESLERDYKFDPKWIYTGEGGNKKIRAGVIRIAISYYKVTGGHPEYAEPAKQSIKKMKEIIEAKMKEGKNTDKIDEIYNNLINYIKTYVIIKK